MYLLYESYYGEIVLDVGDSTNIIGLYSSKEKAIEKAKELIETDVKNNNYVLDIENNNIEEDGYVIMFWNNQENWSCYYEIFIKKMKLDKECD